MNDSHFDERTAPFRRLALAVIEQAFKDAKLAGEDSRFLQEDAQAWITTDNECLRFICSYADVPPERVLKAGRRLHGERSAREGKDDCLCGVSREFLQRLRGEPVSQVSEEGDEDGKV